MKRVNLLAGVLSDALLIACGMLAVVCTAPSAFRIPFETAALFAACALMGLLLSAWMHLPKLGVVPGLLFLGGAVAFGVIRRKAIVEGARVVFYAVTETFSWDVSALSVPEPAQELARSGAAVTVLLLVVAALFGMLIAFALIKSKLALLSILIPIPPFLCGLIFTDQQPAIWAAGLLAVYCGGVLLGHGLRKADSKHGGMFSLAAVTVLIALCALLPAIVPERTFEPISYERRRDVLGKSVETAEDAVLSWVGKNNPDTVDLSREDAREERMKKAFEVYATRAGTYLLRAHSYGAYQDGTWRAAEEYDGDWRSMRALGDRKNGALAYLSVHGAVSPERLTPYGFWSEANLDVGESFIRAQGKTSYLWTFYPDYTRRPNATSESERDYEAYLVQQYTMADGEEKTALRSILEQNGIEAGGDVYDTAQRVASFVRSSGTYTLTPGKVPSDRDFVQYFLTESHRGYCVHFASATTALLQAMEIPARYTVGYRVEVEQAEIWTDVLERSEHAWTEVYLSGVGWLPIESTAGLDAPSVPLDRDGTYTAPTIAPQTPEPDQTPAPQGTSEPTNTPVPTNTPAPIDASQTEETPAPVKPPIGRPNETEEKNGAWWLLLLIPLIPAGWLAPGALIRRRRTERFRQPNAKKAVLELLRYRKKLERFGVPPDPDAEEWAEEAMFSNHSMTEARRELYKRVRNIQHTLYKDRPFKRFICRWVLFRI